MQHFRHRRFTEFLMPASVILAGVLLVVAFGFIINRAVHNQDDNNAGSLPLPPPALADPTAESSDQAVIPIPSESPSASPSTTRPSPPAPVPVRTTRPPQEVTIETSRVPSRVDLTAEGTRDWVHWGEQNKFSLERAAGGDFQILEGAPTAPRFRHDDSPQRFSWRDGSPVQGRDGVDSGINTCEEGNGFTLSVPAADSSRVLRLYVGLRDARGRLDARLSTGGGSRSATLENRDDDLGTAVFTVTYRSSRAGKLNLSWVTAESFTRDDDGDDCGGVALQAATLR